MCVCVCGFFFFFTIISHRIFIISHVRMRGSAGHSVILLAVGRSYSTENCRGLMKVNGKKCSRINDLQAHAHAFLSGFKLMCKVTCGCGTSYCCTVSDNSFTCLIRFRFCTLSCYQWIFPLSIRSDFNQIL